jgi:hypothetical protein
MRMVLFGIILIALASAAQAVPQAGSPSRPPQQSTTAQRKIPCKVPENATMCYWTRGRLQVTEGAGAWRMWKVGTKRIVDIYSGPSIFPPRTQEEVRDPEFPANLERAYRAELPRIERLQQATPDVVYADFEICPLEKETPGASQAVCIETAKNMFFDGSRHIYK